MKRLWMLFTILMVLWFNSFAQTPLTEAINFSVKTTLGDTISIFPRLNAGKIVVLDFFSTSCGPCQTFAHDFEVAYQNFGSNTGDVFFLAINFNNDNAGVRVFDSIFNITLPSASGLEGGGNAVYELYQIYAYPTVIVITPDHQIVEQAVWEPTAENITNAIVNAGGTLVGLAESNNTLQNLVLSPNPANDFLILNYKTDRSDPLSVRIVDIYGSLLIQKELNVISQTTVNEKINISSLSAGIYFVQILQDKRLITRKIIIE